MEPVVRGSGVPPSSGIAGDDHIPLEVEQVKGYITRMARSLSRGDLNDSVVPPGLCGDGVLGSACSKG